MSRLITRLRRAAAGDHGFTLAETIMASTIMAFVTAIAMTAILQVYNGTNQTQQTSDTRDQLDNTFRRLDRELRYAVWVAKPGRVGTTWYTEYAIPTDNTGKQTCRQIILRNGQLILASWDSPDRAPTSQSVLASDVTVSGSSGPVTVYDVGDKPYATASAGGAGVGSAFETQFKQVRVQFTVTVGRVSLPFDSVFTAQNIDRNNQNSASVCSQGRPTS